MLHRSSVCLFAAAVLAGSTCSLSANTLVRSKDTGPTGACDMHSNDSAAWTSCLSSATAAGMPDSELFYAGYWLARSGRYAQALEYLTLVREKDERVLTYIGFATRKQGDVARALPFYAAALAKNPNYNVARAYLGEAYLTRNEPAKARAELSEIEDRCGTACAAYADLAQHIAAYEAANG